MKAIHTNNSTIFVSAVLFLAFAACGNVKKQSHTPAIERRTTDVQKDVGMSESSSNDDLTHPTDPNSPYWYDPEQEEVEFSEDGDTLYRFPRIRKGGDYIVPKSVDYIFERSFQGCRNLISLTIPNTVKHIDMAPFENCGKLEMLVIQCHLDTLPFRFAGGCSSLHDLFLADKTPPIIEGCGNEEEEQDAFSLYFYGVSTESCLIHVPQGSAQLYRSALVWRLFKHYVET